MSTSSEVNAKITPLFALQFCLVLFVILLVTFLRGGSNGARLAGLCIAVPAAILLFTARWQLGSSFSVTPEARGLVTRGIYSKIRNPMYVFSTLMLVGILIALQYRYAFVVFLLLIPMQIVRSHQEAQLLEANFGDEYRKYRKGTCF